MFATFYVLSDCHTGIFIYTKTSIYVWFKGSYFNMFHVLTVIIVVKIRMAASKQENLVCSIKIIV